jgi:hypothetical protein
MIRCAVHQTVGCSVTPGALKLILEPIFEADFQTESYEYRLEAIVLLPLPT